MKHDEQKEEYNRDDGLNAARGIVNALVFCAGFYVFVFIIAWVYATLDAM